MADILLRGVSKRYGNQVVLENINLEIRSGECFTILGPSGCGKTVILRLIAGFEKPDSGTIKIGDTVVADASEKKFLAPEDRKIGIVFQDYAVWPHKTVSGNIGYPLEIAKTARSEAAARIQTAIDQVNLSGLESRMPYQLSGGQQQRVALARALVAKPNLMLLDEPLTNLDANLREEMRFEIKDLQRKNGMTILYVTHDQEVALAISDRIAILGPDGVIRQIGTPREIYENPVDDFVFGFLGVANRMSVRFSGKGILIAGEENQFPCDTENETNLQGDYLAVFRPMDVELNRDGNGAPCVVKRATILGPMVDYVIETKSGATIRLQIQTDEAITRGRLFENNEACFFSIIEAKYYPISGRTDK